MKQALLTGMTPMQCGSERTKLADTINQNRAYQLGLEALGYYVVHRPAQWCHEKADVVFAGLCSPGKLSCHRLFSILQLLSYRPDAILYVDDWDIRCIRSNFQTLLRTGRLWTCPLYGDRELALKHKKAVEHSAEILAWKDWPWPVLVSTHGGLGDLSLFKLPAKLTAMDPTGMLKGAYTALRQPDASKSCRWVWGALSKHNNQVRAFHDRTTWPLVVCGKVDPGELGERCVVPGWVKKNELEALYATSWGLVLSKHNTVGSGWWRPRYLAAAELGAIISADPVDAKLMGTAFLVRPENIENFSRSQLILLSQQQADQFWKLSWSKVKFIDALKTLIKRGMR